VKGTKRITLEQAEQYPQFQLVPGSQFPGQFLATVET